MDKPRIKIVPGFVPIGGTSPDPNSIAVQVGTFQTGLCLVTTSRSEQDSMVRKDAIEVYSTFGFIDEPGNENFPWSKLIGTLVGERFILEKQGG